MSWLLSQVTAFTPYPIPFPPPLQTVFIKSPPPSFTIYLIPPSPKVLPSLLQKLLPVKVDKPKVRNHVKNLPPYSPKPQRNCNRMDMGFMFGNYIVIPSPPQVIWRNDEDVYTYLWLNKKAHQTLIEDAEKKRCPAWGSIWVHHDVLWFPFILHPKVTDEDFKEIIRVRLFRRLASPPPEI